MPDFKLSRVLLTEQPLLNVLHLFANLLNDHLKLDGRVGYLDANGLGSQRVGFTIEFLGQKVQSPPVLAAGVN